MWSHLRVPILTALLGWMGLVASAPAQPALKGKIEEAQEAARSLALYPKEVREAILEVAQHPDLVEKLAAVKDPKNPAVEKLLLGYPADVRKAARLLLAYPETIQTMRQHPALTALVGKFYTLKKDEFQRLWDKEEKTNDAAVQAWTKRLEQSNEAMTQLLAAAEAYTQSLTQAATPTTAESTPVYAPVVYGGAAVVAGAAAVYALPTPAFTAWALANADRYPALADAMVGQWVENNNPRSYEEAVGDWWRRHDGVVPDHVLDNDPNRAKRLAELAHFDKNHPDKKDQPVDKAQKQKQMQSKANEYQYLSSKQGFGPKDPKPNPAITPTPTKKPTPAPAKVEKKAAPQPQQVQHASANHNSSWKGGSPGKSPAPKPKPGGKPGK